MDAEIRSYGADAAPKLKEGRVVEGYAIVFNHRSRLLFNDDTQKFFEEVVLPEAVNPSFLAQQDIKLTRNHNDDLLLARSINGEGSLRYEVDDYGVKYIAEMPETTAGNDTLESVRRGDLFGSSFAFFLRKDGYKDELINGQWTRTIKAFGGIRDFSIVADPAYFGTYVTTRSMASESITEAEKAEEEEKAKQELAKKEEALREYEESKLKINKILTTINNF